MKRKSIIFPLLVFALIGIVSFYILNNYLYQQEQQQPDESFEPYTATLRGKYVCLPHKNQSGLQTLECAPGLKIEGGEYYALDFNALPEEQMNLTTGDHFSAHGVITPVKNLSSDHWGIYDIEGIFSVTDSVTKE